MKLKFMIRSDKHAAPNDMPTRGTICQWVRARTHYMQSPHPHLSKKTENTKLQRGSNGPVWSVQVKACIHENAYQVMSQFPVFLITFPRQRRLLSIATIQWSSIPSLQDHHQEQGVHRTSHPECSAQFWLYQHMGHRNKDHNCILHFQYTCSSSFYHKVVRIMAYCLKPRINSA